jgi:hypothetical protein
VTPAGHHIERLDQTLQLIERFRPGEVRGAIRRIKFGEISHDRLLRWWADVKQIKSKR